MNRRALLYDLQRLQCEAADKGFDSFSVGVYREFIGVNYNRDGKHGFGVSFSNFELVHEQEEVEGKLRRIEGDINGVPSIEKTEQAEEGQLSSQ